MPLKDSEVRKLVNRKEMALAKIYYDKDANLRVLKGKTIAVIGYGAQGHAQAQNLKFISYDYMI